MREKFFQAIEELKKEGREVIIQWHEWGGKMTLVLPCLVFMH